MNSERDTYMENGKVTILAPAKINLYFGVIGMRGDGYHEVETIMQTVSVFDRVAVETSSSDGAKISVICKGLSGVDEKENIAYRAAEAYLNAAGITNADVKIKIDKKIPDGAGLGGGSSDAAAVILALNHMSGDKFSLAELFGIGASIGADVPFCIKKGTVCATGFGENIVSCAPMPDCRIVIASPNGEKISTAQAYSMLAPEGYPSGFAASAEALSSCELSKISLTMKNDFEKIMPEDGASMKIKRMLLENGALAAQMSGSGPAVFGLFSTLAAAKKAKEALEDIANTFVCAPARRDYEYMEK